MSDVIAKALERLDDSCVGELKLWNPAQAPIPGFVKPFAALIRDVSCDTHECVCGVINPADNHYHECSLIALCKAVAGE